MADEFNFDDYDDDFDFGFNTVDEAEVTEYETEIKSRVAEQGETVPSDLGEKIDKLIELRQGDESQMDILQKKYKEEMLKLEKMLLDKTALSLKMPSEQNLAKLIGFLSSQAGVEARVVHALP